MALAGRARLWGSVGWQTEPWQPAPVETEHCGFVLQKARPPSAGPLPPGARGSPAPKPRAPQSPRWAAPQTQRRRGPRYGPSDSEPLRADGENYHGAEADSGALHCCYTATLAPHLPNAACDNMQEPPLTAKAAAFSGRGGAAAAAVTSKACRSHNQAANVAL